MFEMIATILVVTGVMGENLLLTTICGYNSKYYKSGRWYIILFLLLTLQMQVFILGIWSAKHFLFSNPEINRWFSLGILFALSIKILRELIRKNKIRIKTPFEAKSFISIALDALILLFSLGYALHNLAVEDNYLNTITLTSLIISAIVGGLTGKFFSEKTLYVAQVVCLLMLLAGTFLFLFKL